MTCARSPARLGRAPRVLTLWAALALAPAAPAVTACGEPPDAAREDGREALGSLVDEGRAHSDPYVRAETARLLAHAPQAQRGALDVLLGDADPLVALVAADSLLRHEPRHAAALVTVGEHLSASPTPARLAALEVARRRAAPESHAELLDAALAANQEPAVRHRAMADLVALLKAGTLPPERARELERGLTAFATDSDVEVAIVALGYIGSIARLANDARDLRATLHALLKTGDVAAQERALRILTGARDPDLASIAYDPYARAGEDPALARLREVAAIALGSTGEVFRVAELEVIARRDADRELQLAALDALARIDSPDARLALVNALQNPAPEVRHHVLRTMLALGVRATLPENVLRSSDPISRVLGLQVLYAQGTDRFKRVVAQKLEVENFRAPLLEALAAWSRETPLANETGEIIALPWLSMLAPTLGNLRERVANENAVVQAALYELLGRLEGPPSLLARWEELPFGGRYALLRQMLELGAPHESFEAALESPWFVVRLLGAIGTAR